MNRSDDDMTSQFAVDLVLQEFAGDNRPATVEMVAKLYSTMFSQHEATVAMFALVMKNSPHLMFEDDFVKIRKELERASSMLVQALQEMSETKDV